MSSTRTKSTAPPPPPVLDSTSYSIVRFLTEKKQPCMVVPNAWIREDEGEFFCIWPRRLSGSRLRKAVTEQRKPTEKEKKAWKELLINVKFRNGTEAKCEDVLEGYLQNKAIKGVDTDVGLPTDEDVEKEDEEIIMAKKIKLKKSRPKPSTLKISSQPNESESDSDESMRDFEQTLNNEGNDDDLLRDEDDVNQGNGVRLEGNGGGTGPTAVVNGTKNKDDENREDENREDKNREDDKIGDENKENDMRIVEKDDTSGSQISYHKKVLRKLTLIQQQNILILNSLKEVHGVQQLSDPKKVVTGFKFPIEDPDILLKLEKTIAADPDSRTALTKYLVAKGAATDDDFQCSNKVMESLLSNYCGYFLNLEGAKCKPGTFLSDSNRIGLAKAMPTVKAVLKDVFDNVSEMEGKLFTAKSVTSSAGKWLTKRTERLPKNIPLPALPWKWADDEHQD